MARITAQYNIPRYQIWRGYDRTSSEIVGQLNVTNGTKIVVPPSPPPPPPPPPPPINAAVGLIGEQVNIHIGQFTFPPNVVDVNLVGERANTQIGSFTFPSFVCPGAVSFGTSQGGWGYQPPSDSSFFSMSVWLYVTGSQTNNPAQFPNGLIFGNSTSYLFNDPGTSGAENFIASGGFQSWLGNGVAGPPTNDIINVTRANPSVWTFQAPHGLLAESYLWQASPGFYNPGWGLPGSIPAKILSVTPTTITVDFDTTSAPQPWVHPTGDNTSGHGGAFLEIVNSLGFLAGDSTGTKSTTFMWGQQLPPNQWINVLMAIDTNHAAGSKIGMLYFGDTEIPLSSYEDFSTAFNMYFSEPNGTTSNTSWNIFGTYETGGSPNCYAAEMWFAPGQFIDFSNPTNRAKFHNNSLVPVDLGSDGSKPTGTAPLLYLHQPSTPSVSPVKWIDPEGIYDAPGIGASYLDINTLPMPNGITTTGQLVFSFWIDQFTKGDILDLGNGGSFGNISLDYDSNGNPTCYVYLTGDPSGSFQFQFPYNATGGTNIRVGIDTNQLIGNKIVKAYVGGSSAVVTVTTDDTDHMLMDWAGISYIRLFWYSAGYIGDVWIAPGYYVDPGSYFYNGGSVGTLPPFTPSIYFHISGSDTADDFANNLGNGGAFNLTNGSGPGHFSLLSGTEFFRNSSGLTNIKIQGENSVGGGNLQLSPVGGLCNVFNPQAVFFNGQTFLWDFPAMADSSTGIFSVWVYVTGSQLQAPIFSTNYSPVVGDLFNY